MRVRPRPRLANCARGSLTQGRVAGTDVRNPRELYAAIEETVSKLGPRLFVSVANAGVTQVRPLLECTPEYVPAGLFASSACVER